VPKESCDSAGRPGEILTDHDDLQGTVASGLPRGVEVLLALSGLIVAAPVIVLAAAGTVLSSGLPVFFRQKRVGRGGEPFMLIKLRSMRASRGGPQVTARGDARVTPFGRLLRRSKLDELPELWNVLKGEMSFVGPRPEVPELVDPANPLWREVLQARPGLTDPVTVRLRDEEALMAGIQGDREAFYRETLQPFKLRGYREYLQRRSWHSDLGVLWETVLAVLWPSRRGSEGAPTLPPGPPGPRNP
jgi:lipopolysaccharide/colanic/teichoic acid biosynthesis glycosyltransferase